MSDRRERSSKVALLSVLLEDRKLGWAMVGGGLIFFVLSIMGVHFFSCPVKELTSLKCPGCGLTTGSREMLHGEWRDAFAQHWFTPVFMVFWAAVGFGLILPEPWRGKYLNWVRKSERITLWPLILGILLVIYALTRNIISE
ncbi:MAG: DUF2752 domain-containing protein [Akkermansiaceae bacterium]